MNRFLILIFATIACTSVAEGKNVIVADSATHRPLPGASVFKSNGIALGITDNRGCIPSILSDDFPIIIRYLGFGEKTVKPEECTDTIFLSEVPYELLEVNVESRQHKVLHLLAYVREYSNMSTYTDTVFLFREKMVDFMLPTEAKSKFKGWRAPRVLKSDSYYRFSNYDGLDSVSSKCNNHFSWSDWIGIPPTPVLPPGLCGLETGTDTLRGKYSPSEIWVRRGDRVTAEIDILADTLRRKWVPGLVPFFRRGLDFSDFRIRYKYDNLANDSICPTDIAGYSFNVQSRGRGHAMFRFNKIDEPCFVNTFAEVYIIDKEYISVKEARKWDKLKYWNDSLEIIDAPQAPELQPEILQLIARVRAIDHDAVRTDLTPDRRLMGIHTPRRENLGTRALSMLKTLTGISRYKYNRNNNRNWEKFRREQQLKNAARPMPE